MPQTLLQIAQEHSARQGLPVPLSIAGSSDGYARQVMGLLNEFCDDLETRKAEQVNSTEATFTSVATESQGTISTLFPYGFAGILLNTMWDRTQMLRWTGGIDSDEWQFRKASHLLGPLVSFRIRNDQLICNPPPAAGHTIACEYFSKYFVQNGSTLKRYWTQDSDFCRVDDSLPTAYLRWAWKAQKGLEYAEDQRKYERLLDTILNRDNAPEVVNLADQRRDAFPGVLVPAGSWPLP